MMKGKQTWIFENKPVITASSAVGGPFEGEGPLAQDFDVIHDSIKMEEDSFEKAERKLLEEAARVAVNKSGLKKEDIDLFFAGDLINQITVSSFTARELAIPYLGIYGACSTSMEGLALAAAMVNAGFSRHVLAATSSHNSASEKQYRYPTEYGAQKPPTAQWTVTGAGAAVVSAEGDGPRIISATIGKVIDMGVGDPFNMGAAMAPAAVDTIERHMQDMEIDSSYYDLIATGDLGRVGHRIASGMLMENKIINENTSFIDCGILIFGNNKKIFAGGSGCGCAATTTYGHLINRMKRGELKKILVVATGALLSPMSYQQKETIPGIAHAVSLEY